MRCQNGVSIYFGGLNIMDERLKNIIDNYDKMHIGLDEPFKFHCTMCGKCCIEREDILLSPKDVFNMSKELNITPNELFEKYCEMYIGSDSRMPIVRLKPRGSIKRCPLLKDHKCSVHNAKPAVCAMFPIGRCLSYEKDKKLEEHIVPNKVEYIIVDHSCGDDSEIHTVREWFDTFGIPIEDEYFIKWHQIMMELSTIFCKCEKKTSDYTMELAWKATFVGLYLKYDLKKEFMSQFENNAREIIELMHMLPIDEGDETDE